MVWAKNITVDPATLWECSIVNASVVKENVCYKVYHVHHEVVLILIHQ